MRASHLQTWIPLALALGVCALALAQQGEVKLVAGAYPGVVPGTDNCPAVPASPNAAEPTITWPGFQTLAGGGSRVFVQSTAPLGSELVRKGRTLKIALGPARLSHRNNARPLDTRFFDTPVARAYVKVNKGQATLYVELRRDAEPMVSTAPGADGYYFLYVDFPGVAPQVAEPETLPPAVPEAPPPPQPLNTPAAAGNVEAHAQGNAEVGASANTASGKASAGGEAKAGGSLKLGF